MRGLKPELERSKVLLVRAARGSTGLGRAGILMRMAKRVLLLAAMVAVGVISLVSVAAAAQDGSTTSVINGQEAAAGTFPYLAFVVVSNAEETDVCSGSVVSSDVVLTAAHCAMNSTFAVVRDPANFTVVTGNVDWASPARTVSTVSRVAIDPNLAWTIPGYLPIRGDAAVLELSAPIAAPPVQLATTRTWDTGTATTEVGWGLTTPTGEVPETLHVGEAVIQSPEYCKGRSPHFESAWVLCVQDYPAARYSTCHGDSGGPLLSTGPVGEAVQIGITSYGGEECSPSTPQYFTRADAVGPWVAQKVAEWAPPPPVTPTTPTTTAPALSTSTPKPAPAPAAPALPVMTRALATGYATRALQRGMGGHFRGHSAYRVSCSNNATSAQRCYVSWTRGTYYYGTVNLFYEYENGKLVWNDHYRIHKLERCDPRCLRRLYTG